MQYFSEEQVRQLADPDDVIRAIREAFSRDYSRTVRMPVRAQLDMGNGAVLLIMPCYDSALLVADVKIVTVTPQTGVNAIYQLLNAASGEMLAVMEANYLTDLRTAATSAVATDLLARSDVETLGVFGSGRQARAHLTVLSRVRKFRRILISGSPRSDLGAFCRTLRTEQSIVIEPVDAETCARESDVICTCTTSRVPLFDGHWLRPGTHLNLVGAFQPDAREVDDETVRRARVVVDTYEGAMAEAGDILVPLHQGIISREHVVADLHEIASGKKRGRVQPSDITLFKSVGCALEDLVTANLVFQQSRAVRHNKLS
ncbi:MAG TPA: ornithine cyclodeaminase family protein [Verrucomicrobiae bacterium]|jgi:ornithine cyclodeaminase/alanine dehydrogenase-like protein (mu-crystallin family)|nr:ornithine cyclodeaminase family protein [Verrucomicrobiae bacterium]